MPQLIYLMHKLYDVNIIVVKLLRFQYSLRMLYLNFHFIRQK